MSDWNPKDYLGFAAERAQPAIDLIARLPERTAKIIGDLGCGPGNSTALLRQAFPKAAIYGIDSSSAMIAAARMAVPTAVFAEADAATWRPGADTDLVFSNALLQWLDNRDEVIAGILASLASGATLAFQMPDNLDEPSHRLMGEIAGGRRWKEKLARARGARNPLHDERGYYDLLRPLARHVQIWRTTYIHALESHGMVARMLATTGLKPFLDALPEAERKDFMAEYAAGLARHYPAARDGRVLYRFPRLFIIAIRT